MAKASLRDTILEAAFDQFHRHGFTACGMQAIVDASGAPKGSFYYHFKTKELLALEVLEQFQQSSRVGMLHEGQAPPLARLRAHFEFLRSRLIADSFERGCMIGEFAADASDEVPALRAAAQRGLADWTDQVAIVLRQVQAEEAFAVGLDPDATARFLINAWEGAVLRMKLTKGRQPLDDFFDTVFATVLPAASR